jgi:3-oxoacyl-[acyl-carrier-protein] synthase II
MKIGIPGCSVISGESTQNNKLDKSCFLKEPVIPEYKELFKEPLTRYGRFDKYTKIGCSAVALALKDAELNSTDKKRPIGLIISSVYESYSTDIEYYKTTIESEGAFTSPNLFSYTLPGIVLGECSAYFKLTGPTLCIGENQEKGIGHTALQASFLMLESGEAETIITGWLDYPPDIDNVSALKGAVFCILSVNNKLISSSDKIIRSEKVNSFFDIF